MEKELRVIGYPQIAFTKLAYGSELGFTITNEILGEIKLADNQKIAKKHNKNKEEATVSDEEVQKSIDQIRRMQAEPATEGAEPVLPELDDDFVKKIGDFASVEAFTDMVKTNLQAQKEQETTAKRREEMVVEIIEASTFTVPESLVTAELDKLMAQMKDNVAGMGLEWDKYLEHMQKDETALQDEARPDAKRRAEADLILKEIAKAEDIRADQEQLAKQVAELEKRYTDVDPTNISLYVEGILINEATLSFLESQ